MAATWTPEKGWHDAEPKAKVCTYCASHGVFRWDVTCERNGHAR